MTSKLLLLILLLWCGAFSWRLYPEGVQLQVTIEHELLYDIDTVLAIHWHKSGNKFYVMTLDSNEIWVDNVLQIKGGSK